MHLHSNVIVIINSFQFGLFNIERNRIIVLHITQLVIVYCSKCDDKLHRNLSKHVKDNKTLISVLQEKRYEKKSDIKKVVISRNVDSALQEVLDLVTRDYIMSWYSDLSKDQDAFLNSLR